MSRFLLLSLLVGVVVVLMYWTVRSAGIRRRSNKALSSDAPPPYIEWIQARNGRPALSENCLQNAGLGSVAGEVNALIQTSVILDTETAPEDSLPLGQTRIGGRPDLPDGTPWPTWKGLPQSFVAQLNLAELSACPSMKDLPRDGMLFFFYDCEQSTWGFDPKDRGSWQVIHVPDGARLVRTDYPPGLPEQGRYPACRVALREVPVLPPDDSASVERMGLTDSETDPYFNLYSAATGEPLGGNHRVLGWPHVIQGDVQLECQLASNGLYCGDATGYNDPRAKQLAQGAPSWRLLFQVDSDENAGMMWGDAGLLYFMIADEALRQGRFEESWMILQCF